MNPRPVGVHITELYLVRVIDSRPVRRLDVS